MESAVLELDSQDPIFDDDIDVDSILKGFPHDFTLDHDLDLWLSNSPSEDLSSKESETPAFLSSFAEEIEKFLLEDGEDVRVEDGDKVDDFVSGLLVDGFGLGSGSDSGRNEVASPESGGSADSAAAEEMRDGVVVIDGEEREEDEEISKKRRRQMRNRESAMQSRERKKMYVKDLEMKRKYLESECRHLDYALRCCMSENFALHQHLQKDGASAAKQESAVLFVESLLLGSLFWLVSIVCLFLVPSLQSLGSKDTSRLVRGLAFVAVGSKVVPSKEPQPDVGNGLVIMTRRCRGLRTRMKSVLFPLHAVSA